MNVLNNDLNLRSPVSESCTVHTHYTTPSLAYDFSEVQHFLHLKKKKVLPGNIIQAAVRFSCLNVIGKKQMSSIYTSFLGDRLGPTASSYCRWVLCPVYVRHLCVFVLRKPWNSNQAVKKPGNIGVLFACPYWNASPTSESVSQSLQHSGCSAKHYSISQTFT